MVDITVNLKVTTIVTKTPLLVHLKINANLIIHSFVIFYQLSVTHIKLFPTEQSLLTSTPSI
jgi:hypothetical protein